MKEEEYSYKTPSAQLVQIAQIASRYKGRPEMLMKVIIQSQKIVTAFSASVAAVIAREISKIAEGRGTVADLHTIEDLANTMRLTALCGLGHSTAVPVLSSIQNFYPTYLHHIDKDPCPVCTPKGGHRYE